MFSELSTSNPSSSFLDHAPEGKDSPRALNPCLVFFSLTCTKKENSGSWSILAGEERATTHTRVCVCVIYLLAAAKCIIGQTITACLDIRFLISFYFVGYVHDAVLPATQRFQHITNLSLMNVAFGLFLVLRTDLCAYGLQQKHVRAMERSSVVASQVEPMAGSLWRMDSMGAEVQKSLDSMDWTLMKAVYEQVMTYRPSVLLCCLFI